MQIDITSFVSNEDPYEFSGSVAERGDNAGRDTWNNAKAQGENSPLLTTPEQLDALRQHVKGFGAWEEEEIAGWTDAECNALFIQLISGDIRSAGLDDADLEDFDWTEYEKRANEGSLAGNLYRGDSGRIYYYLGS